MSILGNVKVKEMERVLLKKGFRIQKMRGSHATFRHSDGRITTLAYHPGNIAKPIVSKILKQVGISAQEFQKLRK